MNNIITRAEAIKREMQRYFTGRPCKHGHIDERYTNSRICLECSRLNSKSYQENNQEKELIRSRKKRKDNLEAERKRNREYQRRKREEDLEGEQAKAREWRESNPEKQREYTRKRLLKPGVRISFNIRRAMIDSIGDKKAGRPWESLVGYTIDELMAHLERLFAPGMSWENYGRKGWHIDHIIPLAVHNFEFPEDIDFKKAWALKNLQPLWAHDNLSKKDSLSAPFQPSLALSLPTPANDNKEAARAAA